jgi:hypothetical protein
MQATRVAGHRQTPPLAAPATAIRFQFQINHRVRHMPDPSETNTDPAQQAAGLEELNMSLTRKLVISALAAVAALAVMAPVASAGWQIRTVATNALYTGPVQLTQWPEGTSVGWTWNGPANYIDICNTSTLQGSITNPGIPAVAGSISSANWNTCNGGVWPFTFAGNWNGQATPWSLSVLTFAGNQAKLRFQNPTTRRFYSGGTIDYANTTLEGKMTNGASGTIEVQYSDSNDASGLNNTLNLTAGTSIATTIDLQATYRLRAISANQNLKLVQTP